MATVKSVQNRIYAIEGFMVRIRYTGGKDVRDDANLPHQYTKYGKMARNAWTVSQWKRQRFNAVFAGYAVEILDANGHVCQGNTKLASVRDSYLP